MTPTPTTTPLPPYHVTELSIEDGLDIAMWRTPGPWAVQDSLEAPRPDEGYWAVRDANDVLIGYCCFGEAARPPGLPAGAGKLDTALGLAPQYTGRNLSREFARTVIARAEEIADGRDIRCAVAEWNDRGRRTTESVGFTVTGVHEAAGGSGVTTYFVYEL